MGSVKSFKLSEKEVVAPKGSEVQDIDERR